jgi:hypothetical protein
MLQIPYLDIVIFSAQKGHALMISLQIAEFFFQSLGIVFGIFSKKGAFFCDILQCINA